MDFVSTDNKLSATKSLNSVSSPDAAHRLPYNNDTQRREKKNTENSNIRNAGNKISHRKKVLFQTRSYQ